MAAEAAKDQSAEQIRSQEEEIRRLQAMLAEQQANNPKNDASDTENNEGSES